MNRKLLFFFLVFLSGKTIYAITEEPYIYYFKVLSKDTKEGLAFANITIKTNDTVIGIGVSQPDGLTKIETNRKIKNSVLLIDLPGFEKLKVEGLTLKKKDTLTVYLTIGVQTLDQIHIISYQIPMIYPDTPAKASRGKRKKNLSPPPPVLIMEYTKEELSAKYALLDGLQFPDSMRGIFYKPNDWLRFFPKTIIYPEKARDAGIQETIYVKLKFSKSGNLTQANLLKGEDPSLVYAVYKALMTKPGIGGMKNPVELMLPIKFILR